MSAQRHPLKRVQVVYKKSAYELYVKKHRDARIQELIEQGDASVAWMLKSHDENQRALQHVREVLKARGIQVRLSYRAKKESWQGADLVLAVGGDGTLLEAARMVRGNTPLMGIHSTPTASVGYLCASDVYQIEALLDRFEEGSLQEFAVTRLQAFCNGEPVGPPALNDILFSSPSPAATTRYQVQWNGVREEHRSSGLWVATPVGSTAAVLSAGGQQLSLDSQQLQFRVRELYQPKNQEDLQLVGGFLSAEAPLQITNTLRKAFLYFDGPWTKYPLQFGDVVTFAPIQHSLRLVGAGTNA